MTRGPMPLEDIWREFFTWNTDPSDYNVYVHTSYGFQYPEYSFFYGKIIPNIVKVGWGDIGQVLGIKALVEEALKDPDNEWFTMMSESCIPLHPMQKWRRVFSKHDKSIVNACAMDPGEMEVSRWKSSLSAVGLETSYWRKSATWFALMRKHAQIFVDEKKTEKAWVGVPCLDEHYLPTILAYNGLDNETTCSDGFVHHNFARPIDSHPVTHVSSDITPEFFTYLQTPLGKGFGKQCSGFEEVCHFTARKFAPSSKYSLLENIDLILNDDDVPYEGNPYAHYKDLFRVSHNEGKDSYYIIEHGHLREVMENFTLGESYSYV